MKEKTFVTNYINPLLNKYLSWYINTTIDNSKYKGTSDIIGLTKKGQFIAIEIKNEKRLAEKEQVEFINMVKKSYGLAYIVFQDKGIGKKAKENRIQKGYIPFSEFENILKEIS